MTIIIGLVCGRFLIQHYKIQPASPYRGDKGSRARAEKFNGGGLKFLSQDNLHNEDQNRKTVNVTTQEGGGTLSELGSGSLLEPGFWAIAHHAATAGIDSECIAHLESFIFI